MVPAVAFDVGPLSGPRTGIGAAVEALRAALVSYGRENGPDGGRDGPRVDLVPYVTSFRARPAADVRRLPLPAALAHRMWAHTDHPRADRWMRPAQLIHGTNYVVPPSRLPRLVSVYDCWFLRHPQQAHPDVVRAGRVLERALDHGAVVHASSHATARAIAELFPAVPVHVVHLAPIALPAPSPTCPIADLDGHDFVLALSTLERRKNLPRLVQAFGAVAGRHRDLRLVVAGGNGDDRPAVDAAIDALPTGIESRVIVTGYVDEAVRSWLLHHARVLAYPSLDEGFGFPLLDAMQAGLPIVASNAGSIPEVAGDAAITVDPTDIDGLAEALEQVLADTALRSQLIVAGAARLQRFSWTATADLLTNLYIELIQGAS